MNKAHRVILVFFAVWAIVIAGLYVYALKVESEDRIIFYYGTTCPHCEEVEEFMNEVNATSVLVIEMKEVFEDRQNAFDLQKKAMKCGLNVDEIGVPFIYFAGECYIGKDETISLIKSEMARKNAN